MKEYSGLMDGWMKNQNYINDVLEKHEQAVREHHKDCYNKSYFKWEWQTVDHLGIWAFGGSDKNVNPHFISAEFMVPKRDKVPGWYCYIGPQPEFVKR